MKLNLGCGKQKCPGWTRVNLSRADININFETMDKLPIENNSCEVIFCGHLIEHLNDKTNQKLFQEVHRVLKRNGIFRIITPDFDLYKKYYFQNDIELFNQFTIKGKKQVPETKGYNIAERFINQFMSWAKPNGKGKLRKNFYKISKEDFDLLLQSNFNNLKTQKDVEGYIQYIKQFLPKNHDNITFLHINAFNYKRIKSFLKEAGFENIWKSKFKESKYNQLNTLNWDKFEDRSVFVECKK